MSDISQIIRTIVERRYNHEIQKAGLFTTIILAFAAFALFIGTFVHTEDLMPAKLILTENGEPKQEAALSEAHMTDPEIERWAEDFVVNKLMDISYLTTQRDYSDIAEAMLSEGWRHYKQQYIDSGMPELINGKKLIQFGKLDGPARVLKHGSMDGRFGWRIEVPVTRVLHQGVEIMPTVDELTVLLRVVRAPYFAFPEGLAIVTILAKPRNN